MRTVEILLDSLVTDPDHAEALVGDFTEEHAERADRNGAGAAGRWRRRGVARSLPPLLLQRLREAPARMLLTSVLGVIVLQFVTGVMVTLGWSLVSALTEGGVPSTVGLAVEVTIMALCGALGGAVVARLGGRGALATALWLAITYAIFFLANLFITQMTEEVPGTWGYNVVWGAVLIGIPIGAVLGALRRTRVAGQKARHRD
ncbi:MAG: NTP/NDP exchange transporter [Propionibacteriales bacterium]|nr:NTP/NDP exchange transporter [Propionibacteriales bacterium]